MEKIIDAHIHFSKERKEEFLNIVKRVEYLNVIFNTIDDIKVFLNEIELNEKFFFTLPLLEETFMRNFYIPDEKIFAFKIHRRIQKKEISYYINLLSKIKGKLIIFDCMFWGFEGIKYNLLFDLVNLIENYDSEKIIVSHLCMHKIDDFKFMIYRPLKKKIYLDLSALYYYSNQPHLLDKLKNFFECDVDFNYVLFGSDWPLRDWKETYNFIRKLIRNTLTTKVEMDENLVLDKVMKKNFLNLSKYSI